MTQRTENYTEQLAAEIQMVPEEYMPASLTIVHSFR